jgi:hypothetical protein
MTGPLDDIRRDPLARLPSQGVHPLQDDLLQASEFMRPFLLHVATHRVPSHPALWATAQYESAR